ncbi:hypothetical protein [Poseidonibacter ostreae]|uniref:SHOCT domain-containing protein n=1 Tax=Poseidonibacter ostreae TaxID=2654171 RepID=A0A6L4WNU8_9BACT|nr:hypothetical protein [Poseidonibacter ostreae]KAB7884291.1 hypothetical protein GA417_12280 [Poseidonibacter ostreae]KAB7885274.1 hypothetical protein GBG19_14385 [Poseidonibacter ostreae]KAB7891970.1 hypothetical protein GBG18_05120 [Poseidonibacter ostreae]
MLDYMNLEGLSHFEIMFILFTLVVVLFTIIYFKDEKKNVSNEEILKERLSRGEISIEEYKALKDEL